ncbi:hypothetical protein [Streptomyces aureoverticillatus]|uniref:hypothetical protein n=1 Tax=Streptomyces aureoverticillatus TaxID=66871 RepID=UPI0013DC008E|nr:hypothetical protein [Streptomyces aureoverticillatus]QIB46613.1 hypothetical protein G3H79_29565 [Streptomyces aureoverticillatus]
MSDWTPGREPEPTEAEHEIPAGPASPEVDAGADVDPAAPAPLEVVRTPTGNAEVDARLQRLADADHLATDGHIEVYEDVHRGLRDTLTALDAHPGPPVPSGAPHTSYDRS